MRGTDMRKSVGFFAGAIVARVAFPASVDAQVSVAEVEKWIDSEIAGANGLSSFPKLRMEFLGKGYGSITPEQVAALREEVGDKPDHPKHLMLEVELRRQGGPDITEWIGFWRRPDEWRVCQSPRYLKMDLPAFPTGKPGDQSWVRPLKDVPYYLDAARRKDVAWRLLPGQLDRADPAVGYPANLDPSMLWSTIRSKAGYHFAGLLWGWPDDAPGARLEAVRIEGDRWSCEIGNARARSHYSGRWDAVLGRGFVSEVRPRSDNPSPDAIARITLPQWSELAVGDRRIWLARRVFEYRRDGRLASESELVSVAPISDADFDEATRLPDPALADPVRGELTIRLVNDYRDPEVRRTAAMFAGAPATAQDVGPSPASSSRLRTVGWIALGVLVASLGGARWYVTRRRSDTSHERRAS